MRETLIKQYSGIRETIQCNIESIGKLIEQSKALRKIVETIQDRTAKSSLESEIHEIEMTIKSLIDQTNRLFDKYEEFVLNVFKDK